MKNIKNLAASVAAAICMLAMAFALAACSQAPQASSTSSASSSAQQESEYDGSDLEGLSVASMKGPTSIGLAYLMQYDWIDYTVCAAADEVTPLLLQDKVQIARVPANVAAMLDKKTDGSIKVLDVNTLGVLYVVTGDLAIDSVEKLAGHTIYMTGKGTVPEYTVRAVLEAAGVLLSDVTIEFKSEPSEVAAILNNDSDAIGILPQPYATAVTMKARNAKQTIDLTAAWEQLTGGDRGELVTGVTIAKASFVEANQGLVDAYLKGARFSAEYANEHPDEVADVLVDLGILEDATLAEMAIPYCNVVCYTGDEMKAMLSNYLQMLFGQDPAAVGGALPDEAFYYVPSGN